MKKSSLLKLLVSCFLIMVIYLISCNAPTPTTTPVIAPRYQLSGYLDTLFIPVSVFDTLKKKVKFRFYIEAPDTLTLRGWSTDSNTYNHNSDVILYNGRPSSSVQFGPGDFFGNLHLRKIDITYIQDTIKKMKIPPTFVLFAPSLSSNYSGQIIYTLCLTTDDPHSKELVSKIVIPTSVSTNPSPPANE
jgi:hypothetical protein